MPPNFISVLARVITGLSGPLAPWPEVRRKIREEASYEGISTLRTPTNGIMSSQSKVREVDFGGPLGGSELPFHEWADDL